MASAREAPRNRIRLSAARRNSLTDGPLLLEERLCLEPVCPKDSCAKFWPGGPACSFTATLSTISTIVDQSVLPASLIVLAYLALARSVSQWRYGISKSHSVGEQSSRI